LVYRSYQLHISNQKRNHEIKNLTMKGANNMEKTLPQKVYIEKIIDILKQYKDTFEEASQAQILLWNNEYPEDKPQPLLLYCNLDNEENEFYPSYNYKEIHYDKKKMFISELKKALTAAYGGCEAVSSVRANMGCGIFPTLFGIKQELFEDKMPWVQEHLSKDVLAKMGPEDLKIGDEFKAGLEHMAYMVEKLEGTGCMVYPMDLQGVFDTAHLVYGDQIFYDLYDDPEFVHHLLELCYHALVMGMEECLKVLPDSDKRIAHYNGLVIPREKGGIKISEDTSTLLSKAQIEEFVAPYTHKLLAYFGGGYIHYCGKNPHLFETVMAEPLAYGINFGNPDKHDMEYVLKRCAQAGKIYYGSIPKQESETLYEYFKKYLSASSDGKRRNLLLMYYCSKQEREQVIAEWLRANQ